ncbi:MAG TPA: SDR family NAD(P)-dependent oxidoreductase [Terriglobales bacterium]|nr:SDR family NAD(P)-dependent oxidoreductase [Terriglobales bacterium]
MSQPLQNKVALVTGANGGLGTHVTATLLEAGATVAGVARNISQDDFRDSAFFAFPAEITNADVARKTVEAVVSQFGRIDVLAHLVGGFAGGKTVAQTDDAMFQSMLDLNLTSAFNILRVVIPGMRQAKSGRIIAIGSRAAEEPAATIAAYSASKAALVSLIRTVALENKDLPITANVILAGTMDTPGNRKAMPKADPSQWVQPASIASLIVWLASDAGKDVNGAAIPVYGRGL